MPRAFAALAPIALIIAVVTAVSTLPVAAERGHLARVVLELVVACSFLGAGLYVLARERARWFGVLSLGVACGLFLECWRFSDRPAMYTVGLLFGSLWSGPLVHMALAFPSGTIRPRIERAFVAATYAFVIVVQPLPFLFWAEPFRPVCDPCPENLALIRADQPLADALMAVFLSSGVVAMVVLIVHFVRRLRGASAHQRALLAPVAATMGATLTLTAVSAATEVAGQIDMAQATNLAYLVAFACVPVAMLAGLQRSRAYRAEAVSALVDRLDRPLGPDGLRDALAYALDDPTLEVAYPIVHEQRLVDGQGREVDPGEADDLVWTAVERDGRRVAVIGHDGRLDDDAGLVQATGAAVSLALERERLSATLRASIVELKASRVRLVEASDEGRRRVERDLHDGAQPRLVSLLLNLNLARRGGERNGTAAVFDEVEHELRGILAELRALASGILPPALTDLGLKAAVTELAGRMPFRVGIHLPAERLPERVELTAYFLIAEALTNAAKHAHATIANVQMRIIDGVAILEIQDDGIGGARAQGGSGLRGLHDRVDALDGRMTINSLEGAGTTVRAELPCES